MIWELIDLLRSAHETHVEINGKWVPARPLPPPFIIKLRASWLVLTGRADAVIWPGGQ